MLVSSSSIPKIALSLQFPPVMLMLLSTPRLMALELLSDPKDVLAPRVCIEPTELLMLELLSELLLKRAYWLAILKILSTTLDSSTLQSQRK